MSVLGALPGLEFSFDLPLSGFVHGLLVLAVVSTLGRLTTGRAIA